MRFGVALVLVLRQVDLERTGVPTPCLVCMNEAANAYREFGDSSNNYLQ